MAFIHWHSSGINLCGNAADFGTIQLVCYSDRGTSGNLMLLLCHITEGKLGSADGMMVIPIGLMHQWQRCTAEVIGACLLTFFLAAVLIISRKGNRNTQIPFAPFLCTAVVLVWIIELCAGIGVDN